MSRRITKRELAKALDAAGRTIPEIAYALKVEDAVIASFLDKANSQVSTEANGGDRRDRDMSKVICATCGKEMRSADTIVGKAWLCDNKKCHLQIPVSKEEEPCQNPTQK